MKTFLEYLVQFFSFCQGGWVGTVFAQGMRADGCSELQEWGMGRIGALSRPDSFLDRHLLDCLIELYFPFMTKMLDQDWAEMLANVVYWLTRSDSAGVDGGIILLQAAMERFAWRVLVRDRGAISDAGFKALTAADQIRLMLNTLKIPKEVPTGLVDLVRFSKAGGGSMDLRLSQRFETELCTRLSLRLKKKSFLITRPIALVGGMPNCAFCPLAAIEVSIQIARASSNG